jgi:hypothetical protein
MDPLAAIEHGQVLEPPLKVCLGRMREGGFGSLGGTGIKDPARKGTSQNHLGDENHFTSQCAEGGPDIHFQLRMCSISD